MLNFSSLICFLLFFSGTIDLCDGLFSTCSFPVSTSSGIREKYIVFSGDVSPAVSSFRFCVNCGLPFNSCLTILEYYSTLCHQNITMDRIVLRSFYKLMEKNSLNLTIPVNIGAVVPLFDDLQTFISYINELLFQLPLYLDPTHPTDHFLLFESLRYTSPSPSSSNLFLEFGSYQGQTISLIQHYFETRSEYENAVVYGFDSFFGLPELWRNNFTEGAFNQNGVPPFPETKHIKWRIGYYNETVPSFFSSLIQSQSAVSESDSNSSLKEVAKEQQQQQTISFIHIDCDLYSSTKLIFQSLLQYSSQLISRQHCIILLFNELVDYEGYEQHEIKALYEFYSDLYQTIQQSQSIQEEEYVILEMLPRHYFTFHQIVAFRLCIFS